MPEKTCCGPHDENNEPEGQVATYHVTRGSQDFGNFDYCEACAAGDRKHGFTVEEV